MQYTGKRAALVLTLYDGELQNSGRARQGLRDLVDPGNFPQYTRMWRLKRKGRAVSTMEGIFQILLPR